ncbi:MAG: class I SAM-dependent methyltransferase [Flavobacteriaceae bacterium]|nr:class I SAM-dependent methyltransferase [Flavobacteriaceae bacterium]
MPLFKVTDHSVSKEKFELLKNTEHGFLVTTPLPDISELSKYYETEEYISHTDTKRNLFEKVYHLVREYAIKNKVALINTEQEKGSLLDIGCGTGDFLSASKNNGWSVTGIEPNKTARDKANSKTEHKVFDTSKLENLPVDSFDVITLWHVLEHLPNLEEQIHLFKKLLKPNGTLIIAVPNHKSFDAIHYKEFWAAYDVPRHLWHFSQSSIKNLFGKFQIKLIKTVPMKFDSFYVSLLSEKYKTGKQNPFKAFWIGFRSNLKAKHTSEYSSLIYVFKNLKK